MNDKYKEIKKKILYYAENDDDIKAVIAIGSSTRDKVKADEFSDLDLVIVTHNTEKWFSGEYTGLLGNENISFIEPTLGGGKERRSIYDDDKDVDMVVFTVQQFEKAVKEGVASQVMNRGYEVLYDEAGFTDMIVQHIKSEVFKPQITQEEFTNMVNDFYFHNIWACKKLLRGELWSAKMCIDAYLKYYLLRIVELYSSKIHKADVWHDGRFIDRWADEFVLEKLKECFAHYDKEDMKKALYSTHELFAKLSSEFAEAVGFTYPNKAEECAKNYLIKN